MIIPKLIIFWAQRLFFYGAIAAIGVFLIVVAAGSYHPRAKSLASAELHRRDAPTPATALNINALPSLVGNVAMLPAVKNPETTKKTSNLTEQFVASLAKDIVLKNPNGPGAEGAARKLVTPDIGAVLEQFLKTGSTMPRFSPRTSSVPTNILADASIEALHEYLKKFNSIFDSWAMRVASADTPDDLARFFSSVSVGQRDSASQLQALAVPKSFVDVHERAIAFLLTSSALAAQLSRDADNDPLQATLLLNVFQRMRVDGAAIARDAITVFARAVQYALRA